MPKKKKNCAQVVFVGMQIIYPYHQTEISFTSFWLASLHFIQFLWKQNVSCELTLSEEKKMYKCWVYIHSETCLLCVTYTHIYLLITLHSVEFAGDKTVAFDFSDACLFGHPVYFDYQDLI